MNVEKQPATAFDEIYRASNENFKRYSTRLSYSKSVNSSLTTTSSKFADSLQKTDSQMSKTQTGIRHISIKFLTPLSSRPANVTLKELNVEKISLKPRKIVYKDKSEQILPKNHQNSREPKMSNKKKRKDRFSKSYPSVSALKSNKKPRENRSNLKTRFEESENFQRHCYDKVIPELDNGFESMRIDLNSLEKDEFDCKCKEKFSTVSVGSIFESNEMVIDNLYESINTNDNGLVSITDVIRVLNNWNKLNRNQYTHNNIKMLIKSIANNGFIDYEQFKSTFLFNLLN
ncbi:hypothetical protein BpHYR1_044653 [Brachionus plicatilis]|uniref:EF-hand domain-containing protein n=1 Tax=Brachionus plicatilis TaxID=10195 RepID=A0A3M7T646_BRAPC|nr:hypothetical protein BpHYR1_044653 [Brachionus plicatilis]